MTVRLVLGASLALLLLRTALAARCDNPRECLTREGRITFIGEPHKTNYERKLFVTPDGVARYLFLTNANYDGDRSAAIYRASDKKGPLTGGYWLTTTEASDSLSETMRGITVRRYDAPLPIGTAVIVRRLWLVFLEASREENDTILCSPTGVFFATTADGRRLTAGTWSLNEGCLCSDLMELGQDLINYPQFPPAKRAVAARKIEQTCQILLQRVWHAKNA